MNILQFCSNLTDLISSYEMTRSSYVDDLLPRIIQANSLSAAQFGIISGVLLTVLIKLKFGVKSYEEGKNTFLIQWPHINIKKDYVLQLFSPVLMLLLLPIIFLVLTFGGIHKVISWLIIRLSRSNFVGMMGSFDRIWAIEDDESKSIINAVGLVGAKSSSELVSDIRKCIQNIFDRKERSMMKIFYRRGFSKGYHYWENSKDLDLNRYIQTFQCLDSTDIIKDITSLENTVARHCNDEMPFNGTALWQILICEQYIIKGFSKSKADNKYFPLMFRIHHSLGDGVALVKVLKTMLDDKGLECEFSVETYPKKHARTTTMRTREIYLLRTILQFIKCTLACLKIIVEIPACLMAQSIRTVDNNPFHGPILTGEKVAVWTHDDNVGKNILHAIKRIKRRIPGIRFSDLVTTALSAGLQDVFKATRPNSEPPLITSVVPGRFCHDFDSKEILLENQFSVALLDVPVAGDTDAYARLLRVQSSNQMLKASSDFATNYIFLLCASCLLPERILRPLLYSRHATTILSNMPGPPVLNICGGHPLRELVFLVPNKGTTGIGISAFTYGGTLRLGLVADSGVAKRWQLQVLMQGMLREVARLDDITSGKMATH